MGPDVYKTVVQQRDILPRQSRLNMPASRRLCQYCAFLVKTLGKYRLAILHYVRSRTESAA